MAELENRKHERFCQEYLIDYNGTKAAIRAGFKEKSARQQATRLLSNASILARVRELQKKQVDRLAVSQDYVVLQLLETYQQCKEASPVLKYDPATGEMEETGFYQFDSKGALRALELLGKHLAMFDPKMAQNNKPTENNLIEQLTRATGEDLNTDDLPEVK